MFCFGHFFGEKDADSPECLRHFDGVLTESKSERGEPRGGFDQDIWLWVKTYWVSFGKITTFKRVF